MSISRGHPNVPERSAISKESVAEMRPNRRRMSFAVTSPIRGAPDGGGEVGNSQMRSKPLTGLRCQMLPVVRHGCGAAGAATPFSW
jgi:hypothetical protein